MADNNTTQFTFRRVRSWITRGPTKSRQYKPRYSPPTVVNITASKSCQSTPAPILHASYEVLKVQSPNYRNQHNLLTPQSKKASFQQSLREQEEERYKTRIRAIKRSNSRHPSCTPMARRSIDDLVWEIS
jgi:hypothetical protein